MQFCIPKPVPAKHVGTLITRAIQANRRNRGVLEIPEVEGVHQPQKIAVLQSKYFGPDQRVLTVSFMESINRDLRNRILKHANYWECGIRFEFTQGTGDVRISRRAGGYWSYLGTDVLSIPRNRQTMNLANFTMNTPEREFHRVVEHEFGHTLGFPHEHTRAEIINRIDPNKAYAYFRRTSGWGRGTVDSQVLTPLSERSIMGTNPDQTSIMAYQMPGSITKDGRPIIGGAKINDTDRSFAQEIYPTGEIDPDPVDPDVPDPVDPVDPDPIEPLPDGDEWGDDYDQITWG